MNPFKMLWDVFMSILRSGARALSRMRPLEDQIDDAKETESDRVRGMARNDAFIQANIKQLLRLLATRKSAVARLSASIDHDLQRAASESDPKVANALEAQAATKQSQLLELQAKLKEAEQRVEETKGMSRDVSLELDRASDNLANMDIRGEFMLADHESTDVDRAIAQSAEGVLGLVRQERGTDTMDALENRVTKEKDQASAYVGVLRRLEENRGLKMGHSDAQDDPDVSDAIAARKQALGIGTKSTSASQ